MAAALRHQLGIAVDIVNGRYGELTVLVDGEEVVSAGALGFLGILPTVRAVRERVAARLQQRGAAATPGDA